MHKVITYSGKLIDIFNITIEDLNIIDISYGLSNIARFSGQVQFYSVARHSIQVANMLPSHLKLSGLLHDASEAYIGDIISPIKHRMPEYIMVENSIMNTINLKWKIEPDNMLVHQADKEVLHQEKSALFYKHGYRTEDQLHTMREFLNLFHALTQTKIWK
jgi:5'-deoxynucleotidase YfbR-like HD superfamily hydrolase